VQAVRDVTFGVQAGEFLALIGPNGAGKSTCFNMINGQIAPHLELAHHPSKGKMDYDQFVGRAALESKGKKGWNKRVQRVLNVLRTVVNFDHLYIGGGDMPEVKHVRGGLLGADYTLEKGRYRFARVYRGENWNPQLRAPLTQPGVNVKAGEYLLAVNGRNVTADDELYHFLEATAGKSLLTKVGPDADCTQSPTVPVAHSAHRVAAPHVRRIVALDAVSLPDNPLGFSANDAFFTGGRSFYTQRVDAALAEISRLPGRHLYFLNDHLRGDRRFAAALFDGMRGMDRLFQGAATVDAILQGDLSERAAGAGPTRAPPARRGAMTRSASRWSLRPRRT